MQKTPSWILDILGYSKYASEMLSKSLLKYLACLQNVFENKFNTFFMFLKRIFYLDVLFEVLFEKVLLLTWSFFLQVLQLSLFQNYSPMKHLFGGMCETFTIVPKSTPRTTTNNKKKWTASTWRKYFEAILAHFSWRKNNV